MTVPEGFAGWASGRRRIGFLGVLSGLMVLSLLAVLLAGNARGVYWLSHNLDPDYCYLLNALNFAEFHTAGHYDHPGTPVQLAGAIVIRAAHLFGGKGRSLARDVCTRPEYFLAVIHALFVALVLCGLFAAAARFYGLSNSIAATIPVAALLFVSPTLVVALTRVNPEPLLVFAALLLVICTTTFAREKKGAAGTFWFAAVTGIGCAIKITFLPLAIIPFFLLPLWRRKVLFAACALLFFILFTLPIAGHYRAIAHWFLNLLLHTGRYGYGPSGVIALPEYCAALVRLATAEPVLLLGVGAGTAYTAYTFISATGGRRDFAFRAIAGSTAAQVAGLLMVAKHPDRHYLIPALCMSAFTLALVIDAFFVRNESRRKWAAAAGISFSLVLVVELVPLRTAIAALDRKRADAYSICKLVRNRAGTATVYYYCASSLPYALWFGNGYANSRYGRVLFEIYGERYFYNPWLGTYTDFEREVSRKEILKKSPVLYQGFSFETVMPSLGAVKPRDSLEKITEMSGEAVYRSIGDLEK